MRERGIRRNVTSIRVSFLMKLEASPQQCDDGIKVRGYNSEHYAAAVVAFQSLPGAVKKIINKKIKGQRNFEKTLIPK